METKRFSKNDDGFICLQICSQPEFRELIRKAHEIDLLVGGHDQMTLADRGIDVEEALERMENSEYGFLDIQTLVGWKTESDILPDDEKYDASLENPNERYRARRPIEPVLERFLQN